MIDIYIKCSSRAYYLDRLLRSIEMHVTGFGKIVLLNDGIRREYLDKVLSRRSDIEERRSIKLLDPSGAARNPAVADPARFWVEEIRRDNTPYILLLEEDTWITGGIDLIAVEVEIKRRHCLMVKMYWNKSETLLAPIKVVLAKSLPGGLSLEYYRPHIKKLLDLYAIFGIAHGIYRTDYWIEAYDGTPNWAHENRILEKAMKFVQQLEVRKTPYSFCKTRNEMLGQCQSTTARADAGGWWIFARRGFGNRCATARSDGLAAGFDLPPQPVFHLALDPAHGRAVAQADRLRKTRVVTRGCDVDLVVDRAAGQP
jgi:hypothetical protein